MKTLLKVSVAIVALVLVIVLTIPLWIGPVAKGVVNQVAPRIAGVKVHLGDFGLNPFTGTLRVGDFQVWNPPGYPQEMALTLGNLSVSVEPLSVLSSTIRVRDISMKDVFVSYIGNDGMGLTGKKNIDVIRENVMGPDQPAEKASAQKTAKNDAAKEVAAEKGSSRKVIISRIAINGVLTQVGPLTTPIPVPEIRDVGVSSGGVTMETAWHEVSQKVLDSFGSAGNRLGVWSKDGLNLGKDGLLKGQDGLKKVSEKLGTSTDGIMQKAKDLKDVTKSLQGLFK